MRKRTTVTKSGSGFTIRFSDVDGRELARRINDGQSIRSVVDILPACDRYAILNGNPLGDLRYMMRRDDHLRAPRLVGQAQPPEPPPRDPEAARATLRALGWVFPEVDPDGAVLRPERRVRCDVGDAARGPVERAVVAAVRAARALGRRCAVRDRVLHGALRLRAAGAHPMTTKQPNDCPFAVGLWEGGVLVFARGLNDAVELSNETAATLGRMLLAAAGAGVASPNQSQRRPAGLVDEYIAEDGAWEMTARTVGVDPKPEGE